ncbi:MAG: hypothetical protein HFG46_07445 [Clostridium sp.]|nr:hypothetical protein [Clostridium sp.]
MIKTRWIQCPVCNNKTRNKIRADQVLLSALCFLPRKRGKFNAVNAVLIQKLLDPRHVIGFIKLYQQPRKGWL